MFFIFITIKSRKRYIVRLYIYLYIAIFYISPLYLYINKNSALFAQSFYCPK